MFFQIQGKIFKNLFSSRRLVDADFVAFDKLVRRDVNRPIVNRNVAVAD